MPEDDPTLSEVAADRAKLNPPLTPVPDDRPKLQSLRDALGVCIHEAQPAPTQVLFDAGFIHMRADCAMRHLIEKQEGVYDWRSLDDCVDRLCIKAGVTLFLSLFSTPAWCDPSVPPIPRWTTPAIPVADPFPERWIKYVEGITERLKGQKVIIGLTNETNVKGIWASKDPVEYFRQVIKPVAGIIKDAGFTLVAPGVAFSGSSKGDFHDALKQMQDYRIRGQGVIHNLDCHVYQGSGRKTARALVDILEDHMKHVYDIEPPSPWRKRKLFVSETGFDKKDESEQFTNWSQLLDFILYEPVAQNFLFYGFDGFGGPAALLRDDLTPTPALQEIIRRLQI